MNARFGDPQRLLSRFVRIRLEQPDRMCRHWQHFRFVVLEVPGFATPFLLELRIRADCRTMVAKKSRAKKTASFQLITEDINTHRYSTPLFSFFLVFALPICPFHDPSFLSCVQVVRHCRTHGAQTQSTKFLATIESRLETMRPSSSATSLM